MSVSMKAVLEVLEPDEPNYDKAAALGPEALPHLQALVEGDDPMLAAKAAFAASLLEGGQGQDVVAAAARSETASIRVAAAAAARNLPAESASTVLTVLVDDDDPGVRKVAASSVPSDAPPQLAAKVASRPGQAAGAGGTGLQEKTGETPRTPPTGTGATMPGEGQTRMPSEKPAPGLMPGESP
ncbi:hypothetical protein [Arthrobacter sp. CG_A4]|uniref:hypothetical protein n=1 Tax=Arthrobacter sp. CG_A4 TaxID=3071706 RepID=UPI002DF808EE|nr:hypothetical protein [Arthrobacter sp. CG_A4]